MMKPNITPVGTFQRITSTAPLRAETREAIQNTVLQFYIQNSQPEDDAEGLTACYERLSQEDKLDGESNSIINQELLCKGWSHHLIHMTAVHLWQECDKARLTSVIARVRRAFAACFPLYFPFTGSKRS